MRRWLINFQLSTATPKGQQTQGHCTLQSRSSCESCFSPQRSLETHRSQRCVHPDTTALACPGLCRTPCTGKEDCLLQTQPGDEMESCRKMAVQGEDLETEKQRTEWTKAKAIHLLPLERRYSVEMDKNESGSTNIPQGQQSNASTNVTTESSHSNMLPGSQGPLVMSWKLGTQHSNVQDDESPGEY